MLRSKLLPAAIGVASSVYAFNVLQKDKSIQSTMKNDNAAFVFIKNKANTPATQKLVEDTFSKNGITIEADGEFTGAEIDSKMLIDQHYYAIASKATILPPKDLPVPNDKFQSKFGLSWSEALSSGTVYNAIGACKYLGITTDELEEAWKKASKAKKIVKLGGGFYCGLIDSIPGKKPIYVFNAFFMKLRSGFVDPKTSIHYYLVSFSSEKLSWADFRGKVLGPTNPADAPKDSLRGIIYSSWRKLGLAEIPYTGENGVHASASPFEGLAERMNWMGVDPRNDEFGSQLIAAGISYETIKKWSLDPQVKGASLFDQLENMDSLDCVNKAAELVK